MEGLHARQWYQLYSYHSLLGSAIWKLQFIQTSNRPLQHSRYQSITEQAVLMLFS
jgi:hypothetical protein